jgi:tetratricopeptide (TPR) repeat protein
MKQSLYSRYKNYILIAALIVIIIIAVVYFLSRNSEPDRKVLPEQTVNEVTATPSASLVSPVSPVSPLSPIASDLTRPAPEELQSMIDVGLQFYENQDYQSAIDKFNKVLALDPNNYIAYNARGGVYTALEEYENAIADYAKVIELEPFFPHPYYNRGRVYLFLERYNEALADLQKAVELHPGEFGYRANGNIGLIYHKMGEYDKALEAFNESMSYDDAKADVFYLRGETYTALEDYNAAIADYQAALDRFSRYDKAYQSLGYAFYKLGQLDQAIDALNQATTISPATPTAHLYKMLVYVALGDMSNAQTEANLGINSISELPENDQQFLLNRVLANLHSFAQENPTAETEELIKLIETQAQN